MSKNSVIEFVPSKKYSTPTKKKAPAKPRAKRKKPDPLSLLDPKHPSKKPDPHPPLGKARTFEITTLWALGDSMAEYHWRIRTKSGPLEKQVFKIGTKEFRECYFGLVSVKDKKGKWTPFNWGHIPIDMCSVVRELDDNDVIIKEASKPGEPPADGA